MKKTRENFYPNTWIRTCNECSNVQEDKEPQGEMTDAYRNRKCKHCKSESLDYGTFVPSNEDLDY